jgi:hypothetical protein
MGRTVIAFCGAAGSGKDEAARALRSLGFEKRSFAEPLRREVHEALVNPKQGRKTLKHAPDAVKQAFYRCYDTCDFDPWRKPTSPEMRVLLQRWGVWRRSQDEDCYVRPVRSEMPADGNFTITDPRFPNEERLIREFGGLLIRIDCPWVTPMDHESELYWPHFMVDAVIENNAGVDDLHRAVLCAVERFSSNSAQPALTTSATGS